MRDKIVGVYQIGVNGGTLINGFENCSSLEWIDSKAYRYNSLYPFHSLPKFTKCRKLKRIPDGLFDEFEIKGKQWIEGMFSWCDSLEYIPDDIFSNLIPLSEISFRDGLREFCEICT